MLISTPTGYYGWPHPDATATSAVAHNPTLPPPGQHPQHPQQGQELSDMQMLQMLGDQNPTTFEDLNIHMFSGQFE